MPNNDGETTKRFQNLRVIINRINGDLAAFDGHGQQVVELQRKTVFELIQEKAKELGFENCTCEIL